MRYLIPLGLAFALVSIYVAFAADSGWGNTSNGYSYYHETNG
jgi:hypothetical protein